MTWKSICSHSFHLCIALWCQLVRDHLSKWSWLRETLTNDLPCPLLPPQGRSSFLSAAALQHSRTRVYLFVKWGGWVPGPQGPYALGSMLWVKALPVCMLCRLLGVSFVSEDLLNLPLGLIKPTALLLTAVFVGLHTLWVHCVHLRPFVKSCRYFVSWWAVQFKKNLSYKPTIKTTISPNNDDEYSFCVHAKLLQSCLTLCIPMDCSPPGSSIHGILQAGILEWVAMPSRGSSSPKDQTCLSCVSCIADRFSTTEPPGKLEYSFYQTPNTVQSLYDTYGLI